MFLVYFVLTATSIIFGSRSRNKVMGQMQYVCSACGKPSFHTIVRSRRWFTLYFLPVIPMKKSTTERCNLCGFQRLIDNNQADAMFSQKQAVNPMP